MANKQSPSSGSRMRSKTGFPESLCCYGCESTRRNNNYIPDTKGQLDEKTPLCGTPSILSRNGSSPKPDYHGVPEPGRVDVSRTSSTTATTISLNDSHESMGSAINFSPSVSTQSVTPSQDGSPVDDSSNTSTESTTAESSVPANGRSETKGSLSCPVMPVNSGRKEAEHGQAAQEERDPCLLETAIHTSEGINPLLRHIDSEEDVNQFGDFHPFQSCPNCLRVDGLCFCLSKTVEIAQGDELNDLRDESEKQMATQCSEGPSSEQLHSEAEDTGASADDVQCPNLTRRITELVRRYVSDETVSGEDDDTEDQLERDVLWFLSRMRSEFRASSSDTKASA